MMYVGKEDLGLTLSLTSTTNNNNNKPVQNTEFKNNNQNNNGSGSGFFTMMKNNPTPTLQLNLMTSPSFTSSTYTPATNIPDTCKPSYPKGIDVNRPTRVGDGDEDDVGVSSPYSTVSTLSGGKRSSGERDSDDGGGCGGGGGGSDDDDGGENSRKKLRLSKDQSATLEESFKEHSTLNPKQKQALAKRLGLRPRQVEVWFQNRRARTKLKQTEVDCEFLKGCCEKLTEENRRLQKEVLELRTLKMSPQFYMHMTPPTTLTMCPSCERVGGPTSAHSQAHNGTVSRPNHRPMPINLWAAAPVPVAVRPFEGLQPRS